MSKPVKKNVYYTSSNKLNDHIDVLRESENRVQRTVNIARMAQVRKEDRPETISYLTDIIHNSSAQNERLAAAQALINIGTPEAMRPVNEHLVFRRDRTFYLMLRKELKRRYPQTFRRKITGWVANAIRGRGITNRTVEEIEDALSLYVLLYEPGCPVIDVTPFLKPEASPKHAAKIYVLLQSFSPEKIPVDMINDRIRLQYENRTADLYEIRQFCDLADNIKGRLTFTLSPESAKWGLSHDRADFRMETIRVLELIWRNVPYNNREQITMTLEALSKNDPYTVGAVYPVRKRAKKALNVMRSM